MEGCTAAAAQGHIPIGTYPGCVTDGVDKLEDRFISAVNKYEDRAVPQFNFTEPADLEDIPVGLKKGQRAPDFTLRTLEGEEVSLSDFRGQPVLVNFWYTACGPCAAEMPEFEQVYQLEKDAGFVILAVNAGEPFEPSVDNIAPFVQKHDLSFPILLDENGDTVQTFGVFGYPTSYLLDGNGIIVLQQTGILLSESLIKELNQFERTLPTDKVDSAAFVTQ